MTSQKETKNICLEMELNLKNDSIVTIKDVEAARILKTLF